MKNFFKRYEPQLPFSKYSYIDKPMRIVTIKHETKKSFIRSLMKAVGLKNRK